MKPQRPNGEAGSHTTTVGAVVPEYQGESSLCKPVPGTQP
jgi:hypothetical protein